MGNACHLVNDTQSNHEITNIQNKQVNSEGQINNQSQFPCKQQENKSFSQDQTEIITSKRSQLPNAHRKSPIKPQSSNFQPHINQVQNMEIESPTLDSQNQDKNKQKKQYLSNNYDTSINRDRIEDLDQLEKEKESNSKNVFVLENGRDAIKKKNEERHRQKQLQFQNYAEPGSPNRKPQSQQKIARTHSPKKSIIKSKESFQLDQRNNSRNFQEEVLSPSKLRSQPSKQNSKNFEQYQVYQQLSPSKRRSMNQQYFESLNSQQMQESPTKKQRRQQQENSYFQNLQVKETKQKVSMIQSPQKKYNNDRQISIEELNQQQSLVYNQRNQKKKLSCKSPVKKRPSTRDQELNNNQQTSMKLIQEVFKNLDEQQQQAFIQNISSSYYQNQAQKNEFQYFEQQNSSSGNRIRKNKKKLSQHSIDKINYDKQVRLMKK